MPANMENSAVTTGLEKVSFHSNPKERQCQKCSNYHTIALISHTSKVMLKILQPRLQQYVNHKLPDVQAGFRKITSLLCPQNSPGKNTGLGSHPLLQEISSTLTSYNLPEVCPSDESPGLPHVAIPRPLHTGNCCSLDLVLFQHLTITYS